MKFKHRIKKNQYLEKQRNNEKKQSLRVDQGKFWRRILLKEIEKVFDNKISLH